VRRALTKVSWIMVAVGVVLGALHLVMPAHGGREAVSLVSVVLLAAGVAVGLWVHRPGRSASVPALVMVGAVGALRVLGSLEPTTDAGETTIALLAVAVQCGLVLTVAHIMRARGVPNVNGVLGDAVLLALGAWIVMWVILVQPALEADQGAAAAVVANGVGQAIAVVVVFLLAVLLYGDTSHAPSVWFLSLAVGGALIGGMLDTIADTGRADVPHRVAGVPYILAALLAAAAFVHPSIVTFADRVAMRTPRPLVMRLVVTTGTLIIPVLVLAVTDPSDRADRVVRVLSALVLALGAMVRVVQAVQANARAQQELVRTAQTDPLTMLPNRALLLEHIAEALTASWRTNRRPTVLFVDVDRFKNINDSLGHAAGDAVLATVAQRLITALPDRAVVGRISGDEFVVLDGDTKDAGESLVLAKRVLDVFAEPMPLRQGDVFVTASIGVATANPSANTTAADLLRHADTAMYRAKDAGRNCIALFDETLLERVTHRLTVGNALYRALERHELRLFHQPMIDVAVGEVIGFEALMRWERSDGTLVSPAEFIPIAEENGTIVQIGKWAVLEALTDLRRWIDDGICSPSATMSVNVSPRQLLEPRDSDDRKHPFVSAVAEALLRTHLRPEQLWLEVTESVMISRPDEALTVLRELRALGVRVALDDFGTGYSSLSLLQRFPIQRIKIDRAFVSDVADETGARSLVRTIVAMGTSLGLDLVAEGVESIRQLQALSELGCSKAQGYLISHPVPPDAMRSTVAALDRIGSWSSFRISRN
jgi:diguanylate cyclase (GGDEF)-like protein